MGVLALEDGEGSLDAVIGEDVEGQSQSSQAELGALEVADDGWGRDGCVVGGKGIHTGESLAEELQSVLILVDVAVRRVELGGEIFLVILVVVSNSRAHVERVHDRS